MNRRLILLFSILLSGLSAWANSAWQEASELYAAGRYADATAAYQHILEEQPSAEAYYNLGNAYFKQDDLAHAILSYERALRIYPRYADAEHNLRFAESRIVDRITDTHPFFLRSWALSVRSWCSENAWLMLSVCLFIVSLIGWMLFLFTRPMVLRKVGFHSAWITLIFSIIALWSGLSLHHYQTAREEAIITQGIVHAKSSPDKSGTDLFVLHEGTKVRISDTVSEWVEIRVGDHVGWIHLSSLERI